MASCQTFRNTLGNLKTEGLEELLSAYVSSPSEATEKVLTEATASFKLQREQFIQQYQEKASDLMAKWYPDFDFFKSISFEDKSQRIKITRTQTLVLGASFTYFPHLIKEIAVTAGFNALAVNEDCPITSLDYLESTKGGVVILSPNFTSMQRLRTFTGSTDITGTKISSLPSLEDADDFNAQNCPLSSLPVLKHANELKLQDSKITNLDSLEVVGNYLDLSQTPFKSAVSLREVGHGIGLKGIYLETKEDFLTIFPNLKRVGFSRSWAWRDWAFSVSTERQKQIIEELGDKGTIQINGKVLINPDLGF